MPNPNDTLEAQLLQKATSIGPDPMLDRSNWKMGEMPIPGGLKLPPATIEGIGTQMGGRVIPRPDDMLGVGRKLQNNMDLHGPDWVKALQTLYGVPKSSLLGPTMENAARPLGKIGDLLLSRAMGAAYDRIPPKQDILPKIMNKFLPEGQHYPLSTDPKLDK